MKGWRGCAADVFADHGKIAAKMKFAAEPVHHMESPGVLDTNCDDCV